LLVFASEKCAHHESRQDKGKLFVPKNVFTQKTKNMIIQHENLINLDKPILQPEQNSG
jgi:hypothetical protein